MKRFYRVDLGEDSRLGLPSRREADAFARSLLTRRGEGRARVSFVTMDDYDNEIEAVEVGAWAAR